MGKYRLSILVFATVLQTLSAAAWAHVFNSAEKISGIYEDKLAAMTTTSDGAVFIAGYTRSPDFIGTSGERPTYDVFVTRKTGTGATTWIYTTDDRDETATAIAVNDDGLVYVSGYYQTLSAGYDVFLYEFNVGSGTEQQREITGISNGLSHDFAYALHSFSGLVYLAGKTGSDDFQGFGGTRSDYDAFVLELAIANGVATVSAKTMLQAAGADSIVAMGHDGSGIVVAGDTQNLDSTADYVSANNGGADSFVARFALSPGTLSRNYLAVIGGAQSEFTNALAVTADGTVYIAGRSTSQRDLPIDDVFLAKLALSTTPNLEWRYWGGDSYDTPTDLILINDEPVIVGETRSSDLAADQLPGAFQNRLAAGSVDGFVLHYSGSGGLLFGTLLGGRLSETPLKAARSGDSLYVALQSDSGDFPLIGDPADATPANHVLLSRMTLDAVSEVDMALTVTDPSPAAQAQSPFAVPVTILRRSGQSDWVRLSAVLPSGVFFTSPAATATRLCQGAAQWFVCDYSGLTFSGGVESFLLEFQSTAPGSLPFQFDVWTDRSESQPLDNHVDFTVQAGSPFSADLDLKLGGLPNPVGVGSTLHYTHIITNNGPDKATQVVLTAKLDPDVLLVNTPTNPASIQCSQKISKSENTVECLIDSLETQSKVEIRMDVKTRGVKSSVRIESELKSVDQDPVQSNNKRILNTDVNLQSKGSGGGGVGWFELLCLGLGLAYRRKG